MNGSYDATVPSGDRVARHGRDGRTATFVTVSASRCSRLRQASPTTSHEARLRPGLKQQEGTRGTPRTAASTLHARSARSVAAATSPSRSAGCPGGCAAATPPVARGTTSRSPSRPSTFANGDTTARLGVDGTWRHDGSGALRVTAPRLFLDTLAGGVRAAGPLRRRRSISTPRPRHARATRASRHSDRLKRPGRTRQLREAAGRIDYAARCSTSTSGSTSRRASGSPPSAKCRSACSRRAVRAADRRHRQVEHDRPRPHRRADRRRPQRQRRDHARRAGDRHQPRSALRRHGHIAERRISGRADRRRTTRTDGRPFTLATDRITVESLHIEDTRRPPARRSRQPRHARTARRRPRRSTSRRTHSRWCATSSARSTSTRPCSCAAASKRRGSPATSRSAAASCKVDEILARTLFQPYATEQTTISEVDAVAALNPWDRLGLDVALHVPKTLRLTGDSVQVSPGTPIGLGNINLRVARRPVPLQGSGGSRSRHRIVRPGHRHLRVPGPPVRHRSSELDQLPRRPRSRGLRHRDARHLRRGDARHHHRPAQAAGAAAREHAAARRVRHPVADRVQHVDQPALGRAAAGAGRARRRAGRRVPRAAPRGGGSNEIGLDIFEIEPGEFGSDAKVTIGEEIAPGLVARFSRQFGQEAYDEATVEYYLSRLFGCARRSPTRSRSSRRRRSGASSARASTCCSFSASENRASSCFASQSPAARFSFRLKSLDARWQVPCTCTAAEVRNVIHRSRIVFTVGALAVASAAAATMPWQTWKPVTACLLCGVQDSGEAVVATPTDAAGGVSWRRRRDCTHATQRAHTHQDALPGSLERTRKNSAHRTIGISIPGRLPKGWQPWGNASGAVALLRVRNLGTVRPRAAGCGD